MMLPASIQWRLPLSYAGIALLTCLVLGGVLITTMQNYYDGLEQDYLEENAHISARRMERLLEHNPNETEYQEEVNRIAIFSRSRVSLYNPQNEQIATSGDVILFDTAPTGTRASNTVSFFDPTDAQTPNIASFFGPTLPSDTTPPSATFHIVISGIRPEDGVGIAARAPQEGAMFAQPVSEPALWIQDSLLGYRFSEAEPLQLSITRSDKESRVALYGRDQTLLGFLELSQGPAVGREIVSTATRITVIASLVAILAAGIAGWWASRNLTAPLIALTEATSAMTNGQLTTRLHWERQDELGTLATAFNSMADQVNHTIQTLKEFVSDAAHELHTPITALQTNLELASSETDAAMQATYIQHSHRLSERLKTLVNGMLDLTRLESTPEQAPFAPVNLITLARYTQTLYASRAEQANLDLILEVPDHPIHILASEKQLLAALENVLDNALKFSPQEGQIVMGIAADDSQARLWVQDHGIGIPEHDLPRLFRRFHRGQNTAAFPGNGLGLVIVKTIIERHRGQVCIESSHQGTTVTIYLPRTPQETPSHDIHHQPTFAN